MSRIVSVVGARPQFVKLAPIAQAARAAGIDHRIVHTGQHYDPLLSDVFFSDLGIPAPDVHLGIGSGTHGQQTGAMLAELDGVLADLEPDTVLVYGDTNSTLAATLSAVKQHMHVTHLEAGLRSFNRRMPEEHNRVLTDHAADLLLAPTHVAAEHLRDEGLAGRTVVVGDVMTDVLFATRDRVLREGAGLVPQWGLGAEGYYLATIHRADNTDNPTRLAEIVEALAAADAPVILLAHPRVAARAREAGIDLTRGALRARDPLAYPDLVRAALGARGIVTDSGGLQKEAFLLRVPCTTVRDETEWVETVDLGWNVLAHTGPQILAGLTRPRPTDVSATPYGDGRAAGRVIEAIELHL
ncbi:non-hydrolyzing UDP-N-acetylglucosamine 2-epimerase [Rarobacter incanus]|uniref:UDP-N-acetylglucosamine 2-epimerase (Non-hydrolysing) n=1 Tax=Rarobacter incanus TaxID=153494 RepID=A0A542SNS5_9MICO|nr:UDP-N-acetylglucosamine 2-epimerase (non-hydrolyzing) [Rarobacter incanus]TQK76232.1 UDP-N-acetylglucosamine 2-epimerase (non-hydrolysing) [Rarobacter incanus]